MRNLFRAEEVYILAQAIEAMVFQIENTAGKVLTNDGTREWKEGDALLIFNGRIHFRIDRIKWRIFMRPLSGDEIQVWKPRWHSIGDRLLKFALRRAFANFAAVTWKVQMQDYRALFGSQMGLIIEDLAALMEKSEQEARALAKLDKTRGGSEYHPEINRMLQVDDEVDMDLDIEIEDSYYAESD